MSQWINRWAVRLGLWVCVAATGCAGLPAAGPPRPSEALNGVLLRFHHGIRAIEQDRSDDAVDLFEGLVRDYPDVGVFHHDLGVAYRKAGWPDKAAAAYRRAIDLDGNLPDSHYNLAIILREEGKFRESEQEYLAALAVSPDFSDAHYNLGVLYDLYLDRPKEAVEQYRQYLEHGGGDPDLIGVWIAALNKRMEGVQTP